MLTISQQSGAGQYHEPQEVHLTALRTVLMTGRRTVIVPPLPPFGPGSANTSSSIHSVSSISMYCWEVEQQEEKVKTRTRIAGTNASFFIDKWEVRYVRRRCKQIFRALVQLPCGWLKVKTSKEDAEMQNLPSALGDSAGEIRRWRELVPPPCVGWATAHFRCVASKSPGHRWCKPASQEHRGDRRRAPE